MNKIIAKPITTIAKSMGYSIQPCWKMENLPFERHLAQLFSLYGITTVFDVGANVGQYRDFLRHQVGFSGIIHSFEPNPYLTSKMQERQRADTKWHIHNMALGNENGDMPLNIMAKDTFSSFRKPEDSATAKFASGNHIVNTISVPMRKLDDLVLNLVDVETESCYLKIDTQGFDLEVIRGATKFIEKTQALQFELAVQRIYSDVPHWLDMLKIVADLGFDLSGIFPVSRDEHLRAIEMDCIMVKHPIGSKIQAKHISPQLNTVDPDTR